MTRPLAYFQDAPNEPFADTIYQAASCLVEAGCDTGLSEFRSYDTASRPTTVVFPGIQPGTYYVRLRGGDAAGAKSPPSNGIVVLVIQRGASNEMLVGVR